MELTNEQKKYVTKTFLGNMAIVSIAWIPVLLHLAGNAGFWFGLIHGLLAIFGFIVAIFGVLVIIAAMKYEQVEPFIMLFYTKNADTYNKTSAWHEHVPQSIDFILDLMILAPLFILGWYWVFGYFVINTAASQAGYEIYNKLKLKMKTA